MSNVIETPRLLLRPYEADDAEVAFEWCGNSTVMRYDAGGPDTSIDQTAHRVATYRAHQAAYGFSKWVVLDRESGVPIGDAGLLVLEDEGWIDLGFRLVPDYWGQGLATEAATAWIHVAFDEHELTALGAFAHVENLASIRVLEKVGFLPVRDDDVLGIPARVFRLAHAHHR